MRVLVRTIVSSLAQAWGQLTGNKLRTFLSLLGVGIGIFCIVAVQAAVNSLEDDVKASLSNLGDETFYVNRFPWAFDPEYPWWKYVKRPEPTLDEYVAVRERLGERGTAGFFVRAGRKTLKWRDNSVEGVALYAGTIEMPEFFGFELAEGRAFTPGEVARGADVVVLGADAAAELFGAVSGVGREVRLIGRKVRVIGVTVKKGEGGPRIVDEDEGAFVPYAFAAKSLNLRSNVYGGTLMVAPTAGATKRLVRDEVTLTLRAERRLRPAEEDDFAFNNISVFTSFLDAIFSVLNRVGFVVGAFAIFVGGFSVANIMFVSVRERTGLIGVKMALGAARPVILLEFLIESIALCAVGGVMGLGLVLATILGLNTVLPWAIALGPYEVALGVGLAVGIGVLAGVVPAWLASRMDPVAAIRS